MRAAPVAAISGKPPTSLSSSGVPNAERGEQHAGLVDLAVGQHDEVGARGSRRGSSPSATKRGTKRTPGGAAARSGAMSMRGMPDDPQLRALDPPPRLEQHVDALVGAQQAEAQHHRPVGLAQRRPAAAPRRRSARCAKAPWGITCTRAGSTPSSSISRRAAVLGVHDDRVEALVQAPLRGALPGPRLARAGCRGRSAPAAAARGQQLAVELLHGQPLEVHDVGRARGAAVAQHVGDVLGELERRGAARGAGARGGARGRRARGARSPRAARTAP